MFLLGNVGRRSRSAPTFRPLQGPRESFGCVSLCVCFYLGFPIKRPLLNTQEAVWLVGWLGGKKLQTIFFFMHFPTFLPFENFSRDFFFSFAFFVLCFCLWLFDDDAKTQSMKFLAGMHLCLYVHCRQHDCDHHANLTFQKRNSPALCVRVKRSCVFLLSILTIFLILYLKWHFAPPFFVVAERDASTAQLRN